MTPDPRPPLADVLPVAGDPPPRVLFCGINPGGTALADGIYFGRPGNRFWPVLHRAGFTPHVFAPEEQFGLPGLGCGITSLVSRPTARADELTTAELRAGVPRLADTVEHVRPAWVALLGITAFRRAFGSPRADLGPQPGGVGGAGLWVLPNPSGLNRRWSLDMLVVEYARLRDIAVPTIGSVVPHRSTDGLRADGRDPRP